MGAAAVETPIALTMLVALVLCLSLQGLWRATFGPFLHWLAGVGISIHKGIIHLDLHPFRRADQISADVEKYLSQGVAMAEKRFVTACKQIVEPFYIAAVLIFLSGEATYSALEALWKHTNHAVTRTVHTTITKPVHTIIRHTTSILRVADKALAARVTHLAAQVRAIAHAIPHDIALAPTKVGITSKQLRRLSRRLTNVEKATIGLGAVALVGAALGRMGLGWLKCKELSRLGKRVGCGGFGILNELLATSFEALVVLDLCRYALAAQKLAKIVVPQLGAVLLVQDAVCLGGGATLPSAHDSPKTKTKITPPSGLLASEV